MKPFHGSQTTNFYTPCNENATDASAQQKLSLTQDIVIAVINSVLVFVGTLGNSLIIIAVVKTPQLRERKSNFLLLSLAIADLMVTMFSQPLFIVSIILNIHSFPCIRPLHLGYMIVCSFSVTSSLAHLSAISIERAISVVKPHKHRQIVKKWFKKALVICWSVAAVVSGLMSSPSKLSLHTSTAVSASCLLIMSLSYGIILYKIKHPQVYSSDPATQSRAHHRIMEKRVSGATAIIILLFTICCMPHMVYYLSYPYEYLHCNFNVGLLWIDSLVFANSSMNFIIYSLRIRHFRTAFRNCIFTRR